MAVTLTNATTYVRSLLDEPNPQFWSNAELTNWMNEACSDIARRVEWKRVQANIAVTAGTNTYVAPTDIYRIYRIEFAPTGSDNIYTLEWRGYMEMDQIWGINQQWPGSYPLYYTLWKVPPIMNIITYPVPSQAGHLTVYYYQQITPVAAGSDNLDVLEGFEDLVYDYTVYRALRKDADPRSREFKEIYEDKLVGMMNTTRTFQDQAGVFSTGQSALPVWLVSDGLY
jgi:hypothetical protein